MIVTKLTAVIVLTILSLVVYLATSAPRVSETGRIGFFVGLFWLVGELLNG